MYSINIAYKINTIIHVINKYKTPMYEEEKVKTFFQAKVLRR